MNRKGKILFVVIIAVVGSLGWAFWPDRSNTELKITYAGISPTNANIVLFTIENSSKKMFQYSTFGADASNSVWKLTTYPAEGPKGTNFGRSNVTCCFKVVSSNWWRIEVVYRDVSPQSLVDRLKWNLAGYAYGHQWMRISQWLRPLRTIKGAYGPEMLGNKPAPPE